MKTRVIHICIILILCLNVYGQKTKFNKILAKNALKSYSYIIAVNDDIPFDTLMGSNIDNKLLDYSIHNSKHVSIILMNRYGISFHELKLNKSVWAETKRSGFFEKNYSSLGLPSREYFLTKDNIYRIINKRKIEILNNDSKKIYKTKELRKKRVTYLKKIRKYLRLQAKK